MIIVFDGLCNFCNAWVRFVLKRDRQGEFQFAAAQSEPGAAMLISRGLSPHDLETVVLINGAQHCEKSDAVLKILVHFGGLWTVCRVFFIIPKTLRDACYVAFARRRYKWFGKQKTCPVPDLKWRDRFIP